MARFSQKAIECSQNGKSFFITIINSNKLKEMCFVSRKKEDPLKGFQRLLNPKRAKDIANYLDMNKGVIPSALIVSAQDNADIRFDKKNMSVSFEKVKDSLMVIDGQHRLYGLYEAKEDYDIPVIVFQNLTSSEEVKLFIDINTTQKGVPSALLLDIKSQAGTETKLEEKQRNLFDKLNKESVIAGNLLPNDSKAGKISRTVFNSSTKAIFENGPLSNMTEDVVFKAVSNYLEAIDKIFKLSKDKEARLNKSVIFKSVFTVFNEVCEKCLLKYGNVKTKSLEEYLNPLIELNYSEYIGTNKATEAKIVTDIRKCLREPMMLNEDML